MNQQATPTINDVARIAEVSKKTVSRVVNRSPFISDITRARVQAVIDDLGYTPNLQARGLALRRNFLIGLIHDNPNSQMVVGVERGILSAIQGTEFALVVQPVDRGSPDLLDHVRQFLERHRLFGVMLLPPISETEALGELCTSLGCRYVRMGSALLDQEPNCVASNDAEAVTESVAYLIAQGHRRIGLVTGPNGFRSALERRRGFETAMHGAGIPVPPSLVVTGDYRFDSGVAAGRRLLGGVQRPTAIFASNDAMAAGVLHAARHLGLSVPQDVSVIGFDDTEIASHVWPPLTTVRWPIEAMARSGARKLLTGIIRQSTDAEQSLFASKLVLRDSVAQRKSAPAHMTSLSRAI